MITDQHLYFTTGCFGLILEAHEQIQSIAGSRSTIQQIPDDDQVSITTSPGELLIEDPDVPQCFHHGIVCAVYVGDGHDSSDTVRTPVVRARPGRKKQKRKQHK